MKSDIQTIHLARQARETGLLGVLGLNGPASGIADLGAVLVSGQDAASFLHSQLTNEVKALKPGEGNLSARVTRTGTLVRHFSLHCLPPHPTLSPTGERENNSYNYMLLLEREGIPSLISDLAKFAISEDVQFEDVSQSFDWLCLQGPQACAIAEAALGKLGSENWVDLPANSVRALPAGALSFTRSLSGDASFIFALPREAGDLGAVIGRISAAGGDKKPVWLEGDALAAVLEILRIEAGWVRIGIDAVEGRQVLPETGLEQQVVSYSKGCYLGQEVIARIRTYGSVPYVLRGLVLEPAEQMPESGKESAAMALLEKIPVCGSELFLEDGKKVGQIVSRAVSPLFEAAIAFAYLDRANRTPGMKLRLRGKDGAVFVARVALLPFYQAADAAARVRFLHDRAIRLFAEQQDDKAIQLLQEALRLDPAFADGYEALGVILGRSGRFDEAIDIFKRLEEVAPNEPMVHTNLSLFYMKLGDKQAAEEEKAKATVKQFSRFGALKKDELRAKEEEQHKQTEALRKKQMFEEVLEIDPEDPIALFGLGNAYSALGDWSNAEKVLSKASSLQRDNSAIYVPLGKALELLNREADALKVYHAGMAVASKKGDLMPLKEMERRVLLLSKA